MSHVLSHALTSPKDVDDGVHYLGVGEHLSLPVLLSVLTEGNQGVRDVTNAVLQRTKTSCLCSHNTASPVSL